MYDTRRPSDVLGPKFSDEKTRRLVDPPFGSRTLYAAVCHRKNIRCTLHLNTMGRDEWQASLAHHRIFLCFGLIVEISQQHNMHTLDPDLMSTHVHTCPHMSAHVHTCPHMSTHVHSSPQMSRCTIRIILTSSMRVHFQLPRPVGRKEGTIRIGSGNGSITGASHCPSGVGVDAGGTLVSPSEYVPAHGLVGNGRQISAPLQALGRLCCEGNLILKKYGIK
jgi:hypothetical protein